MPEHRKVHPDPPGDRLRLSNSKVKTWRRCPNQYRYKYIEKLRPKKHSLPLKRGDWLHQLMMAHYDGQSWRAVHNKLTREFNLLFEEEREELGDLPAECERIFISYLKHWQVEDAGWNIIDTEMDELVELPNGDYLNFIIDLIVEDKDGGLWLVDHKTVKQFMDADFMLLDTQLPRYFWAAKKLGYDNLRGVMFNELITKAPTVPELLKNGRLTERKNLACDAATYLRAIKDNGLDYRDYIATLKRLKAQDDRWFRRTRLPKDRPLTRQLIREMVMGADEIREAQTKNRWPRSPDKGCKWGCDYLELCITELHGGDGNDIIKLKYHPIKEDIDK